jgi:hypothetical protein
MSYLSFEVEEERAQQSKLAAVFGKVGARSCPTPAPNAAAVRLTGVHTLSYS